MSPTGDERADQDPAQPDDSSDERGRKQELGFLKKRYERLLAERQGTAGFVRSRLIGAATLLIVAIVIEIWSRLVTYVWFYAGTFLGELLIAFLIVLVCAALITAAIALVTRTKLRELSSDVDQIEFQIDLYSHELTERELKAEKLLRLNDFQLRRYYDMNLSHSRRVFALGVWCITAGVAVVFATLYILNTDSHGSTAQITTGALGGIGAILTNFVAAIYLKMNASASDNLVAFHGRLVETHQLMLGNLLASRIDDDKLRWDTLASLALRLAPTKGDAGKDTRS